ncbi:MAG TPA: hypothetical protein DD624_01310 [Alphaproteobacteria bacterium]|nr:hypothetical protein [Alphaproteobacteria bacterium]
MNKIVHVKVIRNAAVFKAKRLVDSLTSRTTLCITGITFDCRFVRLLKKIYAQTHKKQDNFA